MATNTKGEVVYGMVCSEFLSSEQTRSEMAVYTGISSFQGNEQHCYPSLEQIANRSGLKNRFEASRALNCLVRKGWLLKKQRRRKSNLYQVIRKSSIYATIPIVLLQSGMGKNAILCYGALSSFQGNKDRCFPSRTQIANRASIKSLACVSRSLTELEKAGWLLRRKQGRKASIYQIISSVKNEHIKAPKVAESMHVKAPKVAESMHIKAPKVAENMHIENSSMCMFSTTRCASFPQHSIKKNPFKNPLVPANKQKEYVAKLRPTQQTRKQNTKIHAQLATVSLANPHQAIPPPIPVLEGQVSTELKNLDQSRESVLSELEEKVCPHASIMAKKIYETCILGAKDGKIILIYDSLSSSKPPAFSKLQEFGYKLQVIRRPPKIPERIFPNNRRVG